MAMYAIEEDPSGGITQVRIPTVMTMCTPQTKGEHIVKENLGKGDSPREEETTTDEEGESEVSKALMTPQAKVGKGKTRRTSQ